MLTKNQRAALVLAVLTLFMIPMDIGAYMAPLETGPGTGVIGLLYGIGCAILVVMNILTFAFSFGLGVCGIVAWVDKGSSR